MRNIQTLFVGALLTVATVAPAVAAPHYHGPARPPVYRPQPDYRPGPPSYRPNPHSRVEYRAQLRLRQLGYYRGPVDGQAGPGTRRAIARFQHDRRLRATGYLDSRTLRALGI